MSDSLALEANIAHVSYINPALALNRAVSASDHLRSLTICVIEMQNGYIVVGESVPASPADFNEDLGRRLAYEDAFSKISPERAGVVIADPDAPTPAELAADPVVTTVEQPPAPDIVADPAPEPVPEPEATVAAQPEEAPADPQPEPAAEPTPAEPEAEAETTTDVQADAPTQPDAPADAPADDPAPAPKGK